MVSVISTDNIVYGEAWIIKMHKDEVKNEVCPLCKQPFDENDVVICCEVCKKLSHKGCQFDERGQGRRGANPCSCFTRGLETIQYTGVLKIE